MDSRSHPQAGQLAAPYTDGPQRESSKDDYDAEIQDRYNSADDGAADRLIPESDREPDDDPNYVVEWHLRTGWAIALSLLAAALVFFAMVIFTKLFIVNNSDDPAHVEDMSLGFRRPASDYVLNPKWKFDDRKRTREYKWTITDIVANPDGVFRPMITINGKFPGPLIECNEGDTLLIDIDNQSVNATSMHFHGIFQNGTNFHDGTTGVTQCPIAPGEKFRYEFTITGQSGTYYYHGHHGVVAGDGLVGPLVIHSKDEKELQKIEYATDRVIMLQDHYHDLSSGLLLDTLSPGSENSPIPNGALMNGLNKRDCSTFQHRVCDNSSATVPSFQLVENENHRLRFINAGVFAWFQVSIDEHEFAITEVDGTNVLPAWNTQVLIGPAQRYSAIISTNQTSRDAFWLRARMVTGCFSNPKLPGAGSAEVKAILQYSSKNTQKIISEPVYSTWAETMEVQCRDPPPSAFTPIPAIEAPASADHEYYLRSNLEIGDWRLERGFFNKSSFRANLQSPILHRIIDGYGTENETFTNSMQTDGVNDVAFNIDRELVVQHQGIKVVDVVIQNFDEGNHPMHLHGHKFWVLGQGHGFYKSLGGWVFSEPNLSNPLRRDTASVEGFGWMAIRFVTDNPGIWAFHCHMAWHSEAGLAMQFLSQPEVVGTWKIPEANRKLCAADISSLEKGAVPKDEMWYNFGAGPDEEDEDDEDDED